MRHAMIGRTALLALAGGLLITHSAAAATGDKLDFNRDVRPILSDNCFACHGFDKAARKADLRLDTREVLYTKTEDGPAPVVPGKPGDSGVFQRITSTDPDEVMPPAKFHKSLTPAQVDVVKRWIEQGAEVKGHWAYIPPTKPAV